MATTSGHFFLKAPSGTTLIHYDQDFSGWVVLSTNSSGNLIFAGNMKGDILLLSPDALFEALRFNIVTKKITSIYVQDSMDTGILL